MKNFVAGILILFTLLLLGLGPWAYLATFHPEALRQAQTASLAPTFSNTSPDSHLASSPNRRPGRDSKQDQTPPIPPKDDFEIRLPRIIGGADNGSRYIRRALDVGLTLGLGEPKHNDHITNVSWFGCISPFSMLFLSTPDAEERRSKVSTVYGCVYSLASETPERIYCIAEDTVEDDEVSRAYGASVDCQRGLQHANLQFKPADKFCQDIIDTLPYDAIRDAIRDMCR